MFKYTWIQTFGKLNRAVFPHNNIVCVCEARQPLHMSKIIYTIIENQCILLKVFHYTNIFRGKSIYGIPLPISGISVCTSFMKVQYSLHFVSIKLTLIPALQNWLNLNWNNKNWLTWPRGPLWMSQLSMVIVTTGEQGTIFQDKQGMSLTTSYLCHLYIFQSILYYCGLTHLWRKQYNPQTRMLILLHGYVLHYHLHLYFIVVTLQLLFLYLNFKVGSL